MEDYIAKQPESARLTANGRTGAVKQQSTPQATSPESFVDDGPDRAWRSIPSFARGRIQDEASPIAERACHRCKLDVSSAIDVVVARSIDRRADARPSSSFY